MLRWLKKIYRLYMKGARDNHYPIRKCGLLWDKSTKPRDLDECVAALDCILADEDKERMRDWDEERFTAVLHDNLGRWLRNNWGLWDEGSVLHKWFKSIGIWHADDMSGIILTTYYREKHDLPVNLIKQVDVYMKYWSKAKMKGNQMSEAQREMPKYRSHKVVHALKIKSIVFDTDEARKENRETDGSATITPEEEGYAPFKVDCDYVRKHQPKVGGYYVVYKDGYKSWSPAEAFEDGYAKI